MNAPKVLHISTAKTWRGGEQQIAYLMQELRNKQIDQFTFCIQDGAFHDFCVKNNFIATPFKKGFSINPLVAAKLKKAVKALNINIIHCHDSHAHTFAYMAVRLFGLDCPIIVSRRVDFPIKSSKLSHWKYKHPSIKRILCVSDQIKEIIKKDVPDHGHIHTVYSGIDLSKFKHSKTDILRTEYNIPSSSPIVVNIGALADHKDQITFVQTINILRQRIPNLRAFIIGKDQGEQVHIEEEIKRLKLKEYIDLTGFRSDVPLILPHADIFLFTSKTEGLGTSILDAFASGLAVVATPAGGIPELVINKKTGLLGKVKDPSKLAELAMEMIQNNALRQKLIEGAKAHVLKFSKENTAKNTLRHYREILDQSS